MENNNTQNTPTPELSNQPAQTVSLNPSPSPKIKDLKSKIIILLIFIIFIAGIKYQLLNQPDIKFQTVSETDSTHDWKIYRDDINGFQFQYPQDWILKNENGGISLIKYGPRQSQSTSSVEFFDGATLFISTEQSDSIKITEGDKKFSELGFNGFFSNDVGDGSVNNEYIQANRLLNNGKFLKVEWSRADFYKVNDLTYKKYLLQILSTFKFITPQASTTVDNRILLTPENINKYEEYSDTGQSPACLEKFNYASSTDSILYSNLEKGISLSVPYNSKWGSSRFKINPYDTYKTTTASYITFGYMTAFEGCGWVRLYTLTFLPLKSSKEIISDINKDNFGGYLPPIEKKIGDVSVIEYKDGEFCSFAEIIILGTKYNYGLNGLCFDDFENLENIVKTVKLTK